MSLSVFFFLNLEVQFKVIFRYTSRHILEQTDIFFSAKSGIGFEFGLLERKKKKDKTPFSAPLGSVCRRLFRDVTRDVLGVKSVVERDYEG